MNLYALALSAIRKGETYIAPAHAYANTKDDAKMLGLVEAQKHFPESEGFANHLAVAGVISDNFLIAAGWQRKRVRKPRQKVL